ncbi:MAG: alpha/beta hydrolase [Bacteroidetes bacterium]|nr:alpha/beta hydrolase [Bacteroidota bacterium]MDA1121663.1 alpha/beta hydrolase [Bacteroidota bacterium]
MRKYLYRLFLAFVLLSVLGQLVSGCFSFRMSDKKAYEFFKDRPLKPILKKIKVEGYTINYADIGADSLPAVVFLHGAPGAWDAFIHFMDDPELQRVVRMISIDRPGYGQSDYGDPIISLSRQSQILKSILDLISGKKIILVGHSLGGPVAARIAMDYPEVVDGLVLVAPSIDPELEKREWFRDVMKSPLGKLLLPGSIWSTNEEIFDLKEELEEMLPLWGLSKYR